VNTRGTALLCALALLAAGCGSRLSKDELASGAGGTGGGTAVTSGTGVNGAGITTGAKGPTVGSLPVPCGKGTPKPAPAGTIGVSADGKTIKIAVISDRSGQVKVPTASIEESMQAFVDFCNGFGGINGRQLVLEKIDSKLFSQKEATQQACDDKVFAIVGSGSVTDNQGAQTMVDCNLIEVPAYSVTAAKSLSDRLVEPLPNPTNAINVARPATSPSSTPTPSRRRVSSTAASMPSTRRRPGSSSPTGPPASSSSTTSARACSRRTTRPRCWT